MVYTSKYQRLQEDFERLAKDIRDSLEKIQQLEQERLKAEKDLEEARSLTENIIDTVHDALIVLNENLSVSVVNKTFYTLFQLPPEQVIDRFIYDIGNGTWNIPELRLLLESIIPKNSTFEDYEMAVNVPRLGQIRLRLNARVLQQHADMPQKILLTMQDFTEHYLVQNENIKQKDKEHFLMLETMRKEIETVTYSVAHDLSSPLRSINGFISMLHEKHGEYFDKESEAHFQRARESSIRMRQMIDTVRYFLKVISKNPVIQRISLSDLALQEAENLKASEPERKGEFVIMPDIIVNADREMMSIALLHLFDNSWKYVRGREYYRIEFGYKAIQGIPAYYVSDNGIGTDMKHINKIFTPFNLLNVPVSDIQNYGAGLAVVYFVVKQHFGNIWVESEVNKGTTVYFTLNSQEFA